MHDILQSVIADLGIEGSTEALVSAAGYSDGALSEATTFLTEKVPIDDVEIDVVVTGSYARLEASDESDFDYLIVPHSLPAANHIRRTRDLLSAVDEFIGKLGALKDPPDKKKPGVSGLFGQIQSAPDLVERIGLEQDTNISHTRRVLLLQESRSVYRPDLHDRLIHSIVARYLADYDQPKPGPPRFLLNDLIRYWYTVSVDYQAKRWERLEVGWGIRYIKLLMSRRLSFASSCVALLLCGPDQPATETHLVEQFGLPPLARLAQLHHLDGFEQDEALSVILTHASRFYELLSDPEIRQELEKVRSKADAAASPTFEELRASADSVAERLREVFFGPLLAENTRNYMVF